MTSARRCAVPLLVLTAGAWSAEASGRRAHPTPEQARPTLTSQTAGASRQDTVEIAADSVPGRWVVERPAPMPRDTTRAWLAVGPGRRPNLVRLVQPSAGDAWFDGDDGRCAPRIEAGLTDATERRIAAGARVVLPVCALFREAGEAALVAELRDSTADGWQGVAVLRSDPLEVGKPPPEPAWVAQAMTILATVLAGLIGIAAALLGAFIQHRLGLVKDEQAANRRLRDESREVLRQVVEKVDVELHDHQQALRQADETGEYSALKIGGASLISRTTIYDFLTGAESHGYTERLKAYYKAVQRYNAAVEDLNGLRDAEKREGSTEARDQLGQKIQQASAVLRKLVDCLLAQADGLSQPAKPSSGG